MEKKIKSQARVYGNTQQKMAAWSGTILVFKIIKALLANINNFDLQLPEHPDTVPMQIILTT